MAISTEIPDSQDYRFVLRRYDRTPDEPILVQGYDEAEQSRAIQMHGVVAQTVFLRKEETVARATKFGWLDETQAWKAELTAAERILSAIEERTLDVITNASRALARSEMAERLHVQPYDLKRPLARLCKLGQIVMEGEGVHAKYVLAT